ncbi:hypothetical protein [Thermodesulforhabdus norvegica]|uniref:J domain-containing protein n=1 Tax=Thermodesulforhabdus norvegica TaxID=39841 RepID=A0A1I4QHU5_9BACT|nr:hypothetical protein [Thermodesulforhabdus norvegica]SFM39617.1 hypothetical protein SAMN05660836_00046 [Thermodesulforhabdus norvegica]
MYMKKISFCGSIRYVIRDSYWNGSCWTHRDLFDLGADPTRFIHYVGGNGFYFDEVIEDRLSELGIKYTTEELEEVFFPFLAPHIRRIIRMFGSNEPEHIKKWHDLSQEELARHHEDLHPFDKRRVHFLRCGRIDMGNLDCRPFKHFNILLEKSRDERETLIEAMEARLKPREIRTYVYAAFNLQDYFRGSLMRNHPAALDPEKVEEVFLDALCRLNADPFFFRGVPDHDPKFLHPYLRRYVIYFFDYEFGRSPGWEDFIRSIFSSQEWRAYQRLRSRKTTPLPEACKLLGIDDGKLNSMSVKDVTRIYRQLAKKAHPDAGGDHETFIAITQAYESIMRYMALKGR